MQASRQRGFTLIEMTVTAAVIALAAAVAYPSYTQHVIRSHRSAAQAQMLDIASRQQQFLLANRAYASKEQLQGSGYALPDGLDRRYTWDVSVEGSGAPGFTITFTGINGQSADGALSYTHDGVKGGKW